MTLTELALLLLPVAHTPEAVVIAKVVAEVVEAQVEPLTESKELDVALMLRFAADESGFRSTDKNGACIAGDGGAALGPFQLQNVPAALACAPASAARMWLTMARVSMQRCGGLEPDERLAALASGNCGHGRALSRVRMRAARAALASVGP